jgi:DNA invertase Pin-like site-specific DNA recombinase
LLRDRVRDIGASSGRQIKRQILDQVAQDGTSAAEIARRYGIDGRVLRRWKQELAPPAFVAIEITDAETVA